MTDQTLAVGSLALESICRHSWGCDNLVENFEPLLRMALWFGLLTDDHTFIWVILSTVCIMLSFCVSIKLLLENCLWSLSCLFSPHDQMSPFLEALTLLSEQKFFKHYYSDPLLLTWALFVFSFSSMNFCFA